MAEETRNEPLYGLNLDPNARDLDAVMRLATLADDAGLDIISIQDHPYIPSFLETWTLLSAIGARSRRVRLLPNVLCLPLRPPAVLAKAAATLDLITGGRVELGLGAGAFWDGIESYGGEKRSPSDAIDALEEAIEVCMALWSTGDEETVTVRGEHCHLAEARPGPAPAHDIGIWLGAIGPRMLNLTGRAADGWIVSTGHVAPDRLHDMHSAIDRAAAAVGRDPATIRRAYNISAYVEVAGGSLPQLRPGTIVGSLDDVAGQIARLYDEAHMDTLLLRSGGGDAEDQAQRFVTEVIPTVRKLIE